MANEFVVKKGLIVQGNALNKISGFFRKKIASEVKVRVVPELKFVFDAGYIKAESVLKTLNNLNNEDNPQ